MSRRITAHGKTLQEFFNRIAKDCGLEVPSDAIFCKLSPGHWQRSAGAYSWEITRANGMHFLAGYESVTKLLSYERLLISKGFHYDTICDGTNR